MGMESACLSACLSVCLSVRLSGCLSACLSVCLSAYVPFPRPLPLPTPHTPQKGQGSIESRGACGAAGAAGFLTGISNKKGFNRRPCSSDPYLPLPSPSLPQASHFPRHLAKAKGQSTGHCKEAPAIRQGSEARQGGLG